MDKPIGEVPQVSKEMRDFPFFLKPKDLLVFLPMLTAGLYYLGSIYHATYLWQFGVEESMFPVSIERLLLLGLYPFVTSLDEHVVHIIAALATATAIMLALLWLLVRFSKNKSAEKMMGSLVENSHRESIKYLAVPMRFLLVASCLLIFCAALRLASISAAIIGKTQALDAMNSFSRGEISSVVLYTEKLPGPARALQIRCGDKYCAFWLGSKTLVLKYEDIQKIEGYSTNPTAGASSDEKPTVKF